MSKDIFLKSDLLPPRSFYSLDTLVITGVEAAHLPPQVFIQLTPYQKLMYFIIKCNCEVNGLGVVQRVNNIFIITDIFLIKQRSLADGLHVEFDSMALNKFVADLVKQGGDPSTLRVQWHSHVNELPFYSFEDVETIRGYMNDFMISLVLNRSGQYRCRLDIFTPVKIGLDLPLGLLVPSLPEEIQEQCNNELAEKLILVGKTSLKKSQLDSASKPIITDIASVQVQDTNGD